MLLNIIFNCPYVFFRIEINSWKSVDLTVIALQGVNLDLVQKIIAECRKTLKKYCRIVESKGVCRILREMIL